MTSLALDLSNLLTSNTVITFFRTPVSYYDSKTQEESDEATTNYLESHSSLTRDQITAWIRDYRDYSKMNAKDEQNDEDLYIDAVECLQMDNTQDQYNSVVQEIQERRQARTQSMSDLWSRLPLLDPEVGHSAIRNLLRYGQPSRTWTSFSAEPIHHSF